MQDRALRVDGLLIDLEARMKVVEEELNDDDPAEGEDRVESALDKGPMETAQEINREIATDDGQVNIGDTKTLVATVASEARLPVKISDHAESMGGINIVAQSVRAAPLEKEGR